MAVRADGSSETWCLAAFRNNNLDQPLELVATGRGPIDEMRERLDDERVMYGLFRTSDTYDDIPTVKFVYIYW